MTQTMLTQFMSFPLDIKKYLAEKNMCPCEDKDDRSFFANFQEDYFKYAIFRKELIEMCQGNKALEKGVEDYLTKIFTFPVEECDIIVKEIIK